MCSAAAVLRGRTFEQIDDDQVPRLQAGVATFPHPADQLLLVSTPQIGNNPVHGNSSSGLVARLEYKVLEFPSLYPQHVDLQEVTTRRAFAHGDLALAPVITT